MENDNVVRLSFSQAAKRDQEKQQIFHKWILLGTVCVQFDAREQGVVVPEEFSLAHDLRLNFCYSFQIPDFAYNSEGLSATLSFDSGHCFCKVPWKSVFGIFSHETKKTLLWEDNMPQDVNKKIIRKSNTAAVTSHVELDEATKEPGNVVHLDFSPSGNS